MAFCKKSIIWTLIAPIPLVGVAYFAGNAVLPTMVTNQVTEAAIDNAVTTANQLKTLRGYYARNVIAPTLASGGARPSINHEGDPNAIPLPATMIHDLSRQFSEQGAEVNLFSAYPFPNRGDRELDAFQKQAWDHLSANPEAVFSKTVTDGGDRRVRVAVSDRMVAESCVNCHNAHPDTPKSGWRLGDVRGVLEVVQNIESQIVAGGALAERILLAALGGGMLLMALIAFAAWRAIHPLRTLGGSIEKFADGELQTKIGYTEREDEIGAIAQSVSRIRQMASNQKLLESAFGASTTAMMVINPDKTIVFANAALHRTLEQSGAYWREREINVDPNALTGASFDMFYEEPGEARKALFESDDGATSTLTFDERIFAQNISQIHDNDGEQIGFVVQWFERTEAKIAEQGIGEVIAAIASGNLDERLDLDTHDEFMRDVASGMNRICDIVDDFSSDLSVTLSALSDGDLTRRIETDYQGRFAELAQRANATVDRLAGLVGDISSTAGSMRGATNEISEGSSNLASRAENQAASLEETAATMEQITATTKSTAENASRARDLSDEAVKRAARGGEVVSATVEAMNRIERSSVKISDIISVIDGIAFQTNLLALNAAVEAARAGDAGKGFAVVASEVRTLAQRAAEAAKDVSTLISESSAHVSEGVSLVQRTGESLTEIVDASGKVVEVVSEIALAAREQASGVAEIAVTISHMDEITQQNSAIAESSAAASASLSTQADQLANLTGLFRLDDAAEPRRERCEVEAVSAARGA